MEIRKTYKYRIYPNRTQTAIMEDWLRTCCKVWNRLVRERKEEIEDIQSLPFKPAKEFRRLNEYEQVRHIQKWRKNEKDIANVYAQVMNEVAKRVDKAYQKLAKHQGGWPKFKKSSLYESFTFTQSGFKLINNKVKMSRIGSVRVRLHRPVEGKIKTLTIRRKAGKWYACFSVISESTPFPKTGRSVGMNRGIVNFVVLNDGNKIQNPHFFVKSEEIISDLNRQLAHKKKNSRRWKQVKKTLAKAHEKIANQRKDFHHKEALKLVKQYDNITIEDFNIQKMLMEKKISKNISDVGWYGFFLRIKEKSEFYEKNCEVVSSVDITRRCCLCGELGKVDLKNRIFTCAGCEMKIDIDVNASWNVFLRDINITGRAAPLELLPGIQELMKSASGEVTPKIQDALETLIFRVFGVLVNDDKSPALYLNSEGKLDLSKLASLFQISSGNG